MKGFVRLRRGAMLLLGVLVILSLVLNGCDTAKVIKIGFLGQMTGSGSYVGQTAETSVKDRIEEINNAGGINGYKIQLITYDTRSEVPDAVAAAKRFMDQDKVDAIIGPEWSAAAIPIAEIADASKTPTIGTTASNINVTVNEAGVVHPYMFRVCFIDPYQGTAIADFAFNELGKRKVAFITDVTAAYSVGIQQYFEEQFTKLGGEVVAKEGYQANDKEFRAQISKVADSGADLLVVPTATYTDIGLIANQAKDLGLQIQYLGVDGWVADELLGMAGPALEGAYLSSGVTTESPEFKSYNEAFEKKHNTKATVYSYYALDALEMIKYAAEASFADDGNLKPGTVEFRSAMRDKMENMTDVQAFTSKLTIEPDTHNPHNKPVVILGISDSKWQIVKTYEPQ